MIMIFQEDTFDYSTEEEKYYATDDELPYDYDDYDRPPSAIKPHSLNGYVFTSGRRNIPP